MFSIPLFPKMDGLILFKAVFGCELWVYFSS